MLLLRGLLTRLLGRGMAWVLLLPRPRLRAPRWALVRHMVNTAGGLML